MDATPVSPIDHNNVCPSSDTACLPSTSSMPDPASTQAFAQRNLAGIILGVLLITIGLLLWLFLGPWGKRIRSSCRSFFRCQHTRRQKRAGLPEIAVESTGSATDDDAEAPYDVEKGKQIEIFREVYISKDSLPTQGAAAAGSPSSTLR